MNVPARRRGGGGHRRRDQRDVRSQPRGQRGAHHVSLGRRARIYRRRKGDACLMPSAAGRSCGGRLRRAGLGDGGIARPRGREPDRQLPFERRAREAAHRHSALHSGGLGTGGRAGAPARRRPRPLRRGGLHRRPGRLSYPSQLEAALRRSFEINALGPVMLARGAAERMLSRKTSGAIVLLGTMQAVAVFPGSTAYTAGKAALISAARFSPRSTAARQISA